MARFEVRNSVTELLKCGECQADDNALRSKTMHGLEPSLTMASIQPFFHGLLQSGKTFF